jgi:hypothetical protein
MTGKRVSTLTPESSEAPRESRGDTFERKVLRDPVSGAVALVERQVKVSSPELASLAAKYVNMSDNDIWVAVTGQREMRYEDGDGPAICADIRSLAASVLAQAEGTPRK